MQHQYRILPDGSIALYVWFEAMHTRVDMLFRKKGTTPSMLVHAAEEIRNLILHIEKVGNRFNPESEISLLCAATAGSPVKLSDDLYDMLQSAMKFYLLTDGDFDITVNTPEYNSETIKNVVLSDTDHTCTLLKDGIVLDMSGFIKGYALDRIKPLLIANGIENALVSLGNSSIMAMGDVPGPVKNGCLTTSGNATDFRKHIKDPATGMFIKGKGEAQVRTESGAEGEVMAKVEFIRRNRSTGAL